MKKKFRFTEYISFLKSYVTKIFPKTSYVIFLQEPDMIKSSSVDDTGLKKSGDGSNDKALNDKANAPTRADVLKEETYSEELPISPLVLFDQQANCPAAFGLTLNQPQQEIVTQPFAFVNSLDTIKEQKSTNKTDRGLRTIYIADRQKTLQRKKIGNEGIMEIKSTANSKNITYTQFRSMQEINKIEITSSKSTTKEDSDKYFNLSSVQEKGLISNGVAKQYRCEYCVVPKFFANVLF
ncbi:hypothetical protein RFI_14590 [Reticulomyxa filosa]|uniref:Uncharacterized protein n=1 Tax=Reticulomyxa filosa TaxID=46433 RepID=X6N9K4_RETFI|nr:hypothetical protein RFI_14590 [Reticulomyxa filosa]|eukprot:ETO22603.1 hypothetical protein RFI_14590 [Reticulomyxa filosa]